MSKVIFVLALVLASCGTTLAGGGASAGGGNVAGSACSTEVKEGCLLVVGGSERMRCVDGKWEQLEVCNVGAPCQELRTAGVAAHVTVCVGVGDAGGASDTSSDDSTTAAGADATIHDASNDSGNGALPDVDGSADTSYHADAGDMYTVPGDATASADVWMSDIAIVCAEYVKPTFESGCTNAADKSLLAAINADTANSKNFFEQLNNCTLNSGCLAKGKDCSNEAGMVAIQGQCIATCLVDNMPPAFGKMTANCAWCYGAYSGTGACGANHCMAECVPFTPECIPCLSKYCDPLADACKAGK